MYKRLKDKAKKRGLHNIQELHDMSLSSKHRVYQFIKKNNLNPKIKLGERYFWREDEFKNIVKMVENLPKYKIREFTDDEKKDVYRRWLAGESQKKMSEEYKVNQCTISRICTRESLK